MRDKETEVGQSNTGSNVFSVSHVVLIHSSKSHIIIGHNYRGSASDSYHENVQTWPSSVSSLQA